MTEPRATRGSITCGLCHGSIDVEFKRNPTGPARLDIVDLAPMRKHWEECPQIGPTLTEAPKQLHSELVGRIHRLLDGGHYVSMAGSGACTMCGTNREDCWARLRNNKNQADPKNPTKFTCCPACGNGNTHPAPEEVWDCQVWAVQHGAKN